MTATTLQQALREAREMDAPLNARLGAYAAALRELNAPIAGAYDRLVERLIASEAGAHGPGIGDVMPPFLLPDTGGRLVALEDLLARGALIITFNRGHWCPFCRIALSALAEVQEAIAAAGGEVISIVPERQRYIEQLKNDTGARFTLLTDVDNAYGLSLGLVMWVGEEVQHLMAARGLDLPEYHGNGSWFLPLPATFVVGKDGRIKARSIDPDFRRRIEIDRLLAAVKTSA